MRKFVTLAFIGVLAVSVASCGNSQGSNSASGLEVDSLVGPSALEARAPSGGGGGGKGGGKGGGGTTGGSSSVSMVLVNDANGNGSANWGDTVTFNVSTTATPQPQLTLTCTQNGTTVYRSFTGYWDGYPWPWTQVMLLSSGAWTGGAASCTAQLYYSIDGTRNYNLASTTFSVGA